jgi:hypothetical protein
MDSDKFAGCFGKLVYVVGIAVVGAILGGWVLSVMWQWFIVPAFDAPALTIGQAIGLSLIISSLQVKHAKESDDEDWKARQRVR